MRVRSRSSRVVPVSSALALAVALAAVQGPATVVRAQAGPAASTPIEAKPSSVRVWPDTLTLPTYEEGPPDPNPPFDLFTATRFNYPYTLRMNTTGRSAPRAWRTLNLENAYLKCIVLPDLGGHLYSCRDKVNNAEMFYANPSIKFAQIAYRGAWTALGVEFNFPVSHNWMTASPVDFATTRNPDGSASVWVGNIDRPYGMAWRVELRLRPGEAALEQHTTLYNRSDTRHRFYWWTNAGVEVKDDSRIIYPMDFTASHGFADIDTWPVDSRGTDNSVVGNHKFGPVSRFSHGSREPYMAVYHPRTNAGVVHYASPVDLPSKKIWSWSSDPDGLDWRRALSDNNSAYVEIQAGIFRNQETYGFLEPQDSVRFTEFWLPVRGLGGVSRANPEAVVNLTRDASAGDTTTLTVALNVTHDRPRATLILSEGPRTLTTLPVSLTPATTFRRSFPGLKREVPYTVTLKDASGVVLQHTEGRYDVTPAKEMVTGRQPTFTAPAADQRTDGDWLTMGTRQELDGERLIAFATYQEGRRRFPKSLPLAKAAGRLAVDLKQFDAAVPALEEALARDNSDLETWYYLGLARAAVGDARGARLAFEQSQSYGAFRTASRLQLAALEARRGERRAATATLSQRPAVTAESTRAGGTLVALWRAQGEPARAKALLASLRQEDPTSNLLRVEATRLGQADPALWPHLAADPERIIEVAVDYLRAGLYADAVEILGHDYPSGPGVVSEVGMPRPEAHPLIAYYRGFAKQALGQNGRADFDAASRMPLTYVFPHRPDTLFVLRAAIEANADDASAHFLLGSLYLSGGMTDAAMREWETTRRLNPRIPTLHRNMGYTVLATDGEADQAIGLFKEGTTVDATNVGLYYGLDAALTKAGRPASDRADALAGYPDQRTAPATLIYKLAIALAEAGRFDEADALFPGRFFPRNEGGINVRQIYLEVKLRRARALAAKGECAKALGIVDRLKEPAPGLAFTEDGLEPFIASPKFEQMIAEVRAPCGVARERP
jgi:tetratricopeptide (TPR) repeat protein